MVTHSSTLAWRIPRPEKPSGLQSTGLQRVGHNWTTNIFTFQGRRRTWDLNLISDSAFSLRRETHPGATVMQGCDPSPLSAQESPMRMSNTTALLPPRDVFLMSKGTSHALLLHWGLRETGTTSVMFRPRPQGKGLVPDTWSGEQWGNLRVYSSSSQITVHTRLPELRVKCVPSWAAFTRFWLYRAELGSEKLHS